LQGIARAANIRVLYESFRHDVEVLAIVAKSELARPQT